MANNNFENACNAVNAFSAIDGSTDKAIALAAMNGDFRNAVKAERKAAREEKREARKQFIEDHKVLVTTAAVVGTVAVVAAGTVATVAIINKIKENQAANCSGCEEGLLATDADFGLEAV
jgi:hypothetical protein